MNAALTRLDATPNRATLVIALTALCFGTVPLFARELLAAGLSPEGVALYRFALALPLALLALPRERRLLRPALAMVGGGMAMGLGWTAYLRVIEEVPLAAAGVVYLSYPLFVVVLARFALGRGLTTRALLSAGLVLGAGTLTLMGGEGGGFAFDWVLRCLPAPIGFALVVVLLAEADPRLSVGERWASVAVGATFGLASLSLVGDGAGLLPSAPGVWWLLLAMMLVTTAIPQWLHTRAIRLVGAARAPTAGALELPTMTAVGWLAFGERPAATGIAAGILIVAAVVISPDVTPNRRRQRSGWTGREPI